MRFLYCVVLWAVSVTPMVYGYEIPPPPDNDRTWQASIELGVLITSGNSDTKNINSKLNVTQEYTKWRNTYALSSLYEDADDETTAEDYDGSIQSDYKFNTKEFLYVRGAYEKDRFSGYLYQSSVSTGYGNRLWQRKDGSFFEASAGVGYRVYAADYDYDEDAESYRGLINRFALKYENHFSPFAFFRQELNTEIGLEDGVSVTESTTSLQANIMKDLAMKLSYEIEYTSEVPSDTERLDTETSVSLLYSF